MSIIRRMRKQTAVYWQRQTADAYGRFSFAAPVEISCRWDDYNGEVVNAQGQVFESIATVYVDRDMNIGDRLMLGDLESDTPSDPMLATTSFEIRRMEKIGNFRVTEFLRIAYL